MNREQAEERFHRIGTLYLKRRHSEALTLINVLETVFPNSTQLAYLRAQNLAALGRIEEAGVTLDALKSRIEEGRTDYAALRDLLSAEQIEELKGLLDRQQEAWKELDTAIHE